MNLLTHVPLIVCCFVTFVAIFFLVLFATFAD